MHNPIVGDLCFVALFQASPSFILFVLSAIVDQLNNEVNKVLFVGGATGMFAELQSSVGMPMADIRTDTSSVPSSVPSMCKKESEDTSASSYSHQDQALDRPRDILAETGITYWAFISFWGTSRQEADLLVLSIPHNYAKLNVHTLKA